MSLKYGIVIFPESEVQDRVNALRKRYDSHYNLIAPHVTVKEAFELDDVESAVNHIEEVTKKIPPFTLKVNKIKTFLPTSPVVYLAFEENPVIKQLHEKINSGPLYHEATFKFIPHITIAQDLSSQELSDIYGRLKLKDFEMSFPVDRIHLLYQLENETWTNHQTFMLRGTAE